MINLNLKNGQLIAQKSTDPEYPGIDIEYIANQEDPRNISRPRVLFEENDGQLRVLIWSDPNSEDYTECIEF